MSAGLSQLPALALQLSIELGIAQGDGRLVGEGLEQGAHIVTEAARAEATDHERPEQAVGADERDDGHGPPAGTTQDREVLVAQPVALPVCPCVREVGDLHRAPLPAGPANERLVEVDAARLEVRHRAPRALGHHPDSEQICVGVELEQRAAVRVAQLHREVDDRAEHLVDVEARAHHVAHLGQRLELVDPAPSSVDRASMAPRSSTLRTASAPCAAKVVSSEQVRRRRAPPSCATR